MIDSVAFLCRNGPAYSNSVDDDEPTADEAMDYEEDDDAGDEANALIVFDQGGGEA